MHRKFEIFPEMKLCSLVPNSTFICLWVIYIYPTIGPQMQYSKVGPYWATSLHKYFFLNARMPDCPASCLLFTIARGHQCFRSVLWIWIRIRSNPELFWPGQIQIRIRIWTFWHKNLYNFWTIFQRSLSSLIMYAKNLPIIFRGPGVKGRVRIWNVPKTRIRTKNHSGSTTLTFYIIYTITALSGRSLEDIYCKVSGPESG